MTRLHKRLVRPFIEAVVSVDSLWEIPLTHRIPGTRVARERVELRRLQRLLEKEPQVHDGPFKGMVYPWMRSTGSALVPKLLGTYESELTPVIEEAISRNTDQVIDIGCAEGYFAVGLARRLPHASVFAFDIDPGARQCCRELAEANRVSNISVKEECTTAAFEELPRANNRLVISDCEGYEADLFTMGVCKTLAAALIIIEVHEMKRPGCRDLLDKRLSQTHRVEFIRTVPSATKAHQVTHPVLHGASPFAREAAVSEHRGSPMEWLVARPIDKV